MKFEYYGKIIEVENDDIEIEIDGNEAKVFLDDKEIDTFYIEETIENLVRDRLHEIGD